MRKETLFAILAGISIGLIFAFGSWKVIKNYKSKPQTTTPRPTPKINKDLFVTLDKTNDYDVVTTNEYKLTGTASPNSKILVLTQENDYLANTKPDGSFEIIINLPNDLSQIKILNLNNQGQFSELKLAIVYSKEFLNDLNKEDNLKQKPISYVGTVTDISGDTIQIKDPEGEIKQTSVEEDTIYINGLKKNVEIKLKDIAIGDYVVAMGFVNGNKVLKTKRILITAPIVENKYEPKLIKIEKLAKTKINEMILPKKWNGPNIKDLEIGQNIIIVGLQNEDKFDIRSIFVIE